MAIRISGAVGQLKVGNQVAADLTAWQLVPGDAPGSRSFTARCQSVNAFLMSQAPDVLALQVGRATWRWHDVSLEYGDNGVSGTLFGQPEVR